MSHCEEGYELVVFTWQKLLRVVYTRRSIFCWPPCLNGNAKPSAPSSGLHTSTAVILLEQKCGVFYEWSNV